MLFDDLDELILSVRDLNSREYIGEAIQAFRSKSFRAAIISTWIAVTYDIINKLRELESRSDAQAKVIVDELDTAISTNNIVSLQKIEEALLERAFKDFEFLNHSEYLLLQRLKEDRNLCAHPAFITETILFKPTAELVKSHIVHSIRFLLMHAPVQGKSMLAKLKNDLLQKFFPQSPEEIEVFISGRYLQRSKQSLRDNMTVLLLKWLVNETEIELTSYKRLLVLCLRTIHNHDPETCARKMKEFIQKVELEPRKLEGIFYLFEEFPKVWEWLGQPEKVSLNTAIRSYKSTGGAIYIAGATSVPELRKLVLEVVETQDLAERQAFLTKNRHPIFSRAAATI